jgi:multiple sugar transport system ATP-binding protein
MAQVIVKDVNKDFERQRVVKDFNLEIRDKEFVVLVGPSGCGKSTTLRMVAGLEDVTSGTIIIGDRVVTDLPPKDRDIAMVFQNYALYPHMTVAENIAFGLRVRKFPRTEIHDRVLQAADVLGLTELLDRKPRQLSGGQRQRVALGRAIVRSPKVFLFDEPLSNLDAKLRVQMRIEIKRLHRRLQATAVYVTHDQVEAMTLGDRIVVMREGLIQQVGEPMDVYAKPANKFVAGFIGSPAMNFTEVEITEQDGAVWTTGCGLRLKLPQTLSDRLKPSSGRHVTMGIRPEHVKLEGGPESGSCGFDAIVEIVEPLGSEVLVQLTSESFTLIARVDPKTSVRAGQPVRVTVDLDQLQLFDIETTRAI